MRVVRQVFDQINDTLAEVGHKPKANVPAPALATGVATMAH
jgi:hypothetical protein